MKILHIITDLDHGGAETMLYELASRMDPDQFTFQVISLTDLGPISEKLAALGIPVRGLGLKPSMPNPFRIYRLKQWIKEFNPDLIQTWMYHADLVGGIAGRMAGKEIPIVWGIHHSIADLKTLKWSTRATVLLNAKLSQLLPARIVCCSQSALDTHVKVGFDVKKMDVIPNGFDLKRYKRIPNARKQLRAELGLPENTTLVGLCARFHPDKDHRFFFKVASRLHKLRPDIHFVLCGTGIHPGNQRLMALVREAGLQEVCLLLGKRDDIPAVLSALDLLVSTSRSEAFPLIVGEALAVETLCIVTDVGDSALIVNGFGTAVPFGKEEAFVQACTQALSLPITEKQNLGRLARAHIEQTYNISDIIDRYKRLYLFFGHD